MSATGVTGTPSPFPAVASAKTLNTLEFAAVLEIVAGHAVSELGASSVLSRVPVGDPSWIDRELATARELQRLLDSGDRFRPERVGDIGPTIERLDIPGSVLEPTELNAIGTALGGMRAVRAELSRIGDDAPLLAGLVREIPPTDIEDQVARSLEPDGSVKDNASQELARARRGLRETRARLIAVLERQLRSLGQSDSQVEVTLKDGRYVIPVRRDDRDRIKGIVHGESASGATLFVEPPEAVELGNELNSWISAEARAVLAVLRDLTETIRPFRYPLMDGLHMCTQVDDAYARARFAIETNGVMPEMVKQAHKQGTLRIQSGAHPLLLAEGETAVPFDLELKPREFTLLVSGPNAGGKTVLLKAVGLISTMAQSGVIPPVGKGTALPVFHSVYVDIGDHQSIAASLSTFSAHVAALKEVLQEADAGTLVLLDELGGGTDPIEGAALAGATLLSLNDRCSTTLATTHLSELKELAARTEGVVNASLEFDTDTLTPTYRFVKDRPGRSFGLAIARRMGLPSDVIECAERLQPKEARSLEAVLADLEHRERSVVQQEQDITLTEARLEKQQDDVGRLQESLASQERQLTARHRELEREGREQARRFLLDARRRVEEALGIARAAVTEATAKEARRLVEEGVTEEAKALDKLKREGWRVSRSGERGAGSGANKSVSRVKLNGPGRTGGAPDVARQSSDSAPSSRLPAPSSQLPEVEAATTEIDLRGMTGDEAAAVLLLALDSAVANDLPWLRIIHGKGTGALRARVGQVLRKDERIRQFHLAPPQQGGSGVTVVEFI